MEMIYSLTEINHLENDLTFILERLENIYEITFEKNVISISSKINDNSDAYFTTDENTKEFNKHIPTFKSIHKDMYAFIESISLLKMGKFKIEDFESKYPDFKAFRLLNNMFKHPEKKTNEITFTKVVQIFQKRFDLLCNFKYQGINKHLMYSSFIVLFLTIIIDLDVIIIKS